MTITISILYDNNPYDNRMRNRWGFAALIDNRVTKLLFDAGLDGNTLLNNMRIMGIKPTYIQGIALSHEHPDHIGGLHALLVAKRTPVLYIPPSFRDIYKHKLNLVTTVVEVVPGQLLSKNIFTTGGIEGSIVEQCLVVKTKRGIILVTGCAYTGIVKIVEDVKSRFGDPIRMVLGGFHLRHKSVGSITAIIDAFRRLGVEKVAPCHCTGDRAIKMFANEYGGGLIRTGVGKVFHVGE